jgi:hypothetical protein
MSDADDFLNKCFVCPSTCKICIGPDATQNCSVCNTGFYQLGQGCYEVRLRLMIKNRYVPMVSGVIIKTLIASLAMMHAQNAQDHYQLNATVVQIYFN